MSEDFSSSNSTGLYGNTSTPIPNSNDNLIVRGDLIVLSGNILTTAKTGNIFPQNATTVNLGASATTVNIGADTGTTSINNNLIVDGTVTGQSAEFNNITIGEVDDNTISTITGDLKLGANTDLVVVDGSITVNSDATVTGTTLLHNTTITGTLGVSGNITAPGATLGNIKVGITTDNTIDTTTGNLVIAPATGIITVSAPTTVQYAENNNRLNRFTFQSSNGNDSGVRVLGPNTTSSSQSTMGTFGSSDPNNGSFVNLRAINGGINPLRIFTGKYTGGTLGPSGVSLAFVDNTLAYATVNPAGPTDPLDLTTVDWVENYVTGGEFVFQKINIDDTAYIDTVSLTLNAGATQVLDSWPIGTYGSVKYQIQARSTGNGTQVSEATVMDDGVGAFVNEYAVMASGSDLYNGLTVDVSGGNVRLLATVNFASTAFKVVRTAIHA